MRITRGHTFAVLAGPSAAVVSVLAVPCSVFSDVRSRADDKAEKGAFRLHKFEQPSGQESPRRKQGADELRPSFSFHLRNTGTVVALTNRKSGGHRAERGAARQVCLHDAVLPEGCITKGRVKVASWQFGEFRSAAKA